MGKKAQAPWKETLRVVREQRGFSQTELADKAQVSARTIYRAEKEGTIPGTEIIVQLAVALGEDPREWVKAAGRAAPTAGLIESIKGRLAAAPLQLTGSTLEEFIHRLRDRRAGLTEPGLMCVCYSSEPTGPQSEDIIRDVSSLIAAGLHLAMFLPYTVLNTTNELAMEDTCAFHYGVIAQTVIKLAREYVRAASLINEDAGDRIKLLVPRIGELLCIPPASAFRIRPTYVTFRQSEDDSQFEELGIIAELPKEDEPKWFPMPASYHRAWKSYFSAALKPWRAGTWKKGLESSSWVEFDIRALEATGMIRLDSCLSICKQERSTDGRTSQ